MKPKRLTKAEHDHWCTIQRISRYGPECAARLAAAFERQLAERGKAKPASFKIGRPKSSQTA